MSSSLSSHVFSDPRLKAPKFFAFLERRGELTFEQLPRSPGLYRPESDMCWAVFQNKEQVGTFYYWAKQQSAMYEGKVPGAEKPVNGRVAYADPSREDIVLHWKGKMHARARRSGRQDGWTTIEFP